MAGENGLLVMLTAAGVLLAAIPAYYILVDHTTAAPLSSTPTMVSCPTEAEVRTISQVNVKKVFGLESCAFAITGETSPNAAAAVCPRGWLCTFASTDKGIVLLEGNNQKRSIVAGTWRYSSAYPGLTPCEQLSRERKYLNDNSPPFQVNPDGFICR